MKSPKKDKLEAILNEIRALESKVESELIEAQKNLNYHLKKRKVVFEKNILAQHRLIKHSLVKTLFGGTLGNYLAIPFIYSMIIPAVILDAFLFVYQNVALRFLKIPLVERRKYMIIDRHKLAYLNFIEKLNCAYCGYFNGLIAYAREVAARTEQYWCPIRHARRLRGAHSRYHSFTPYGEGERYESDLKRLRESLIKENKQPGDSES